MQQPASLSAQGEVGISPHSIHNYIVIRKSRITEYIDYRIVGSHTPLGALEWLIDTHIFLESSVSTKLTTTFEDKRLLVQRTQLFDYYIIEAST